MKMETVTKTLPYPFICRLAEDEDYVQVSSLFDVIFGQKISRDNYTRFIKDELKDIIVAVYPDETIAGAVTFERCYNPFKDEFLGYIRLGGVLEQFRGGGYTKAFKKNVNKSLLSTELNRLN